MVTGVGEGGGSDGGAGLEGVEFEGGVGFEGAEDEFPEGGSEAPPLGAVELPPQPASASTITTTGTLVVVVLARVIVLTPIRRRLVATTDRDKHQLFPNADSNRYTSTRSMPPLFARAT